MSSFLSEAQRMLDENHKRRVEMLRMPIPEKSERFTMIADLDKTSFFHDMEASGEPDLDDEWRAELVSMTPSEFARFMMWIWQGEAYEQ